jgi:hypothetical protein
MRKFARLLPAGFSIHNISWWNAGLAALPLVLVIFGGFVGSLIAFVALLINLSIGTSSMSVGARIGAYLGIFAASLLLWGATLLAFRALF